MQFSITITGEGAELTNALIALRSAIGGQNVVAGSVIATIDASASKPAKAQEAKPEKKTETKTTEAQTTDTAALEEADPQQTELLDGPIPTVEELRAKAQTLGASKKEAIKSLLDERGFKNISSIPEDKRAAFMQALGAL